MADARLHDGDAATLFALSLALGSALASLSAHDTALAHAQALDAVIDLPDLGSPPPQQLDAATLAPLPSLYLAHQLDAAGLLRTGELIAGLYASAAIGVPLDPKVNAALHDFWRTRNERLSEAERSHLYAQVFDAATFEPRMRRLCEALVALADNAGIEDIRENVGLQHAAVALAEALWPSISGMVSFAARDVIEAIQAALRFLRERGLQVAFGARDLWTLVATTNRAQGLDAAAAGDRVERGRSGAVVLRWLADNVSHGARLDLADAQAASVIGAAERWLLATVPTRAVA
jgi:hypothetical protein